MKSTHINLRSHATLVFELGFAGPHYMPFKGTVAVLPSSRAANLGPQLQTSYILLYIQYTASDGSLCLLAAAKNGARSEAGRTIKVEGIRRSFLGCVGSEESVRGHMSWVQCTMTRKKTGCGVRRCWRLKKREGFRLKENSRSSDHLEILKFVYEKNAHFGLDPVSAS